MTFQHRYYINFVVASGNIQRFCLEFARSMLEFMFKVGLKCIKYKNVLHTYSFDR